MKKNSKQGKKKQQSFEIQPLLGSHQVWVNMIKKYAKGKGDKAITGENVLECRSSKLGTWIGKEGLELFGDTSEWKALKNLHCNLHYTAFEIIKLTDSGRKDMALSMLDGPFRDLSKKVRHALKALAEHQ